MCAESSEEQISKAYIGRLNKAKKEISKIVCDLNKANNQELNNELFKGFCDHNSQNPPLDKSLRWVWGVLFIIILIVIFGASCYVAAKVGVNGKKLEEGNSTQIFLAFVVALASYLASVARETVKALSLSNKDRIRYKTNIFMMAIAEIQLVIISVLTMCKIAFLPGFILRNFPALSRLLCESITLNSFLVSYLLVTMFWLALIHFRVWWITAPWDVYKPSSK
jgi:hypothetical protein